MTERLRIDDQVVGYRRLQGAQWFYSPDMYAWSGNAIEFSQTDRSTGVRDRNRRLLFERDILEDRDLGYMEISFDESMGRFLVVDMHTEDVYPEEWLTEAEFSNRLLWKSYSFLQQP